MKIKTLSSLSLAAVACDVLLVGAFEGEVTVDTAVANSGNGSHATDGGHGPSPDRKRGV